MSQSYQLTTIPFKNDGIVQSVDPSKISGGHFVYLKNLISTQEGSINSRLGSAQYSSTNIGSLIHTLELFRTGASPSEQWLYVGEGTQIHRLRRSAPNTVSLIGTYDGGPLDPWGGKWTGLTYFAGSTGKSYFYVASSKMMKDPAVTATGTQTTAFQRWGILPPAAAPNAQVSVVNPLEVTLDNTFKNDWGSNPGYTSTPIEAYESTSPPINFGQFPGGEPSGTVDNLYNSDDFIELTITPNKYSDLNGYLLQFDVGIGSDSVWDHYYEKFLIPMGVNPDSVGSSVSAGGGPQVIPPSSPDTPEVRILIKKSDFLKVGYAGQRVYNYGTSTFESRSWESVRAIRLWASSNGESSSPSLTINSIRLVGGSGPDNAAAGSLPYDWLYTYRNDETGHESNPCPGMLSSKYITSAARNPVNITVPLTPSDAQVASIVIYRRGGIFTDGEYRRVGVFKKGAAWPGSIVFTDRLSDGDLSEALTLQFDNDPPVPSRLPIAFTGTYAGNSAGTQVVAVTVVTPQSQTLSDFITIGTRMVIDDVDRTETIQVTAISGNNMEAYFQIPHAGTINISCDSVVAVPCRLAHTAFGNVYLAGDRNNPHIIYRSKSGSPESFPAVTTETQAVNQVVVGSQSNPVMAITDFNGELISLNLYGIYVLSDSGGFLNNPQETPAQKGLVANFAWCKANNTIFYLSDDGIYSWNGGQSIKISAKIDWFFKEQIVNSISPLSKTLADIDFVRMEYWRDELHVVCRQADSNYVKLRYHAGHDRWSFDLPSSDSSWTTLLPTTDALFTGKSINSGGTVARVFVEDQGYTDNGVAISVEAKTGWYDLGAINTAKMFGDVTLEYTSVEPVTVQVYYDFSVSPGETFVVPASSTRTTYPLPLNNGEGKEASAIQFRLTTTNTSSSIPVSFNSLMFNWFTLEQKQRGRATDYSDVGWPYDKRLDQLIIEYDTDQSSVTLNVDVISGINGNQETLGVTTLTLNGNRSHAVLPLRSDLGDFLVCKLVRIRPTVPSSGTFKIFNHDFKYEKYPPDITLFTEPNDYGTPYDKHLSQLVLDVDTGGVPAGVAIHVDNNLSPSQTVTVTSNQKDRQRTITLNGGIIGKKARLVITPGATGKFQLFDHSFIHTPVDKGPVLHSFDFDDLGHPYDKRMYLMDIEYDVPSTVNMVIEGVYGVAGAQLTTTIGVIFLTGSGRKKQQFVFPDGSIYKLVRIRPLSTVPETAKIYKPHYDFQQYPADIVLYTETTDSGYPFLKHYQQLVLDVDTAGIPATVRVEIDGSVVQTISGVIGTALNRKVYLTLNPGITGKKARLLSTPGTDGKFQLFSHDFIVLPADKGGVAHSFDWDTLGTPNPKRLNVVTLEYDTGGFPLTMVMDTIGENGVSQTLSYQTFNLTGTGRAVESFPITDNTIVTAVRFRPSSIANVNIKHWSYQFQKVDYPPYRIPSTEWDDLGYKCEKIVRSVTVDIDTGGVPASFNIQRSLQDGATATSGPYTITTNASSRVQTVSLPEVLIGYKFRIVPSNPSAKFQVFGIDWNRTLEPCPVTFFDTLEQSFGGAGYKLMKQIFIEYRSPSEMLIKVYRDNNTLFYTKTLPPHASRSIERFFLPSYTVSGNARILNKSKIYRITLESVEYGVEFYQYRDGTRVSYINLSRDQESGYNVNMIWQDMPLQK